MKYISMARKHRRAAAALARAAKASKDTSCQPISNANVNPELPLPVTDSDSDIECTSWTGGVIHVFSDSEDEHWADSDSTSENDSGFDDLEELEGEELIRSLQIKCQHKLDLKQRAKPTPLAYNGLLHTKTPKDWKMAESKRSMGYNGLSKRRKREVAQKTQETEAKDKVTRNR